MTDKINDYKPKISDKTAYRYSLYTARAMVSDLLNSWAKIYRNELVQMEEKKKGKNIEGG